MTLHDRLLGAATSPDGGKVSLTPDEAMELVKALQAVRVIQLLDLLRPNEESLHRGNWLQIIPPAKSSPRGWEVYVIFDTELLPTIQSHRGATLLDALSQLATALESGQ